MKYLYKNKHWSINKDYNLDKLLYLMIDRPNKITNYREFIWINNKNVWHRDYDLPAEIYYFNDGTCNLYWYKNDKLHRGNIKPAYINWHGYNYYYINNKLIETEIQK